MVKERKIEVERERVGGVDAKKLLRVCIYYVAIL